MEEIKDIVKVEARSMQLASFEEIAAQVKAIEKCITGLMKEGLHFGTIPGCGDKKALKKPGAEMLSKLFQIRPKYRHDRHDLGGGHFEIISYCTMISHTSGAEVGEGSGSCSTMESKYRWRKAERVCPKCIGDVKRSKFPPREEPTAQPGWYCAECKAQFVYNDPEIRNQKTGRIENPDIADQYNTVLKMADKRAYVAGVITATGASDYVTQDIGDDDDPQQEPAGDPAIDQENKNAQAVKMRDGLLKEVESVIGKSGEMVTAYFIEKGNIKKGQTWRDMEIPDLNMIAKSGKGFIVMVNSHFDKAAK